MYWSRYILGLFLAIGMSAPHARAAGGPNRGDTPGRVIPFGRDALVIDPSLLREHDDVEEGMGSSRRNLLGLEHATPYGPGKWAAGVTEKTLRVIGIRVQFPYEDSDDPQTAGRGHFDLRDTLAFFDSAGHNFDSSPHNRSYFEAHLRALDRYYEVVSNGKLAMEWAVYPFAQDSAYQVPQKTEYYGRLRGGDSSLVWGLRQFIEDAVTAASADPAVHFSDYDAVIVFHAGNSRQFDVLNDTPHDLFSVFVRRDEPIILRNGADTVQEAIIIPETASQDGRTGVINGVLAHEFGHQLGLVDLYDTRNFATQVGNFSLMDNNVNDVGIETEINHQTRILFGALPAFPDPWSRAYLGFVEVETVTDSNPVIVWSAEEEEILPFNRQVWRIPISATEYYLIENRQDDLDGNKTSALKLDSLTNVVLGPASPESRQLTREYDFLLPGAGMLIWHIDEGVAALDYLPNDGIPTNYLANTLQWDHARRFVSVVEADGYQQLGSQTWFFYTGGRTDYWFAGNNVAFTQTSNPPAVSFTGAAAGVQITNISIPTSTMTCRVSPVGRRDGFPVYVGAQDGEAAAPVVTDVRRFQSGDYRAPGDGSPEVFLGYKNYILAFDSGGLPLLVHPIPDTVVNFDTARVERTLYPVAAAPEGEEWIGPPVVYHSNGQTSTFAAVSRQGDVHLWRMFDGNVDGLFDPIVDSAVSTPARPSGPPIIWDRPGTTTTKDLLIPLEDSTYQLYSMIDGSRSESGSFPAVAVRVTGFGPDNAFVTLLGSGHWYVAAWNQTPRDFGLDSLRATAVGDVDRDGQSDAVLLSASGRLYLVNHQMQDFEGFPLELGFRPSGDPILSDIDRDGYLDIAVCGEGRATAIARNGVILNDYPVTLGPANKPDSATATPLAVDLGGAHLALVTGGDRRLTLAYRDGQPVPEAMWPVGGELTTPLAWAHDNVSGVSALYARANDGYLYAYAVPDIAADAATAVWTMGGRDCRNSRAIPDSSLEPIQSTGEFFVAERAFFYPNPAQGEAVLRYWLGGDATVSIKIYDIAGNLVKEADGPGVGAVYNEWTWPCADVASGVYYARLRVTAKDGGQTETLFCKMAVVQ